MHSWLDSVFALVLPAVAMAFGAFLRSRRLDPELTRKATHLTVAGAVLPLPWLVHSSWFVVGLGVIATVAIALLRRRRLLAFLDDVKRSHLSEYAYIAGIVCVFVISGEDRRLYVASILVLGVCDALAAIVGKRFGAHRYTLFGATRSFEGSAALALSAFAIVLVADGLSSELSSSRSRSRPAEAVCRSGLDNFVLPVLAAVLLQSLRIDVSLIGRAVALVAPVALAGVAHQLIRARGLLTPLTRSFDEVLFGGRLVFGANKTFRAPVVMPVFCLIGFSLEQMMGFTSLPWWAGAIVGLAHVVGELPNSYLKRRLGIEPGGQSARYRALFFAVDHLDSATACAIAFLALGAAPSVVAMGFVIAPVLHVVLNRITFILHVREAAW